MRALQNKTAYRFLIIRWSGMGDVVMTLPALKWLSDHFANCRICYLTDIAFEKIPKLSGLAHRVETIDRRRFKSPWGLIPAILGTLVTTRRLRRMRFHMVFDLQGFGETSIIAFLTGAPIRVGRIKGSPLRMRMYTVPIKADWEHEHRSRYFVKVIAGAWGFNAPESPARPLLPICLEKMDTGPKRIGLNIGASTESRRWSEQYFFHLATRLSQKGFTIRFFLGPQEAFLEQTVKNRCSANHWELCQQKDLDSLLRALSECCLLVSNDTGPGHLAAALGIPVVTLFSTGSPENVGPLATHGKWFRNQTDIDRISVSEVEKAALELLSSIK